MINYAPLSNLTMYRTGFKVNTAYAVNLCTRFLNLLSAIIIQCEHVDGAVTIMGEYTE